MDGCDLVAARPRCDPSLNARPPSSLGMTVSFAHVHRVQQRRPSVPASRRVEIRPPWTSSPPRRCCSMAEEHQRLRVRS